MNEKQFLKTTSRVREILEADEYSREDDIYLTWKFWKSIDPLLEELTMKQFKILFLSGYFGLPAAITRSRALLQNETSPELRGVFSHKTRTERGEILRRFFASEGSRVPDPDLEIVKNNLEGDEILERLRDLRVKYSIQDPIDVSTKDGEELFFMSGGEILAESRVHSLEIPPRGEIQDIGEDPNFPEPITELNINTLNQKLENMRKTNDKFKGEKYYSLQEFLQKHRRGMIVDLATAGKIKETAARLTRENGLEVKIRPGTGIREGIRIQVFKQSILDQVINETFNK